MTGQRGESCARVALGLFLILAGVAFLGWSATALFWPEQMVDGFDAPLFVRTGMAAFVVLLGLWLLRFGMRVLRFRGGHHD